MGNNTFKEFNKELTRDDDNIAEIPHIVVIDGVNMLINHEDNEHQDEHQEQKEE